MHNRFLAQAFAGRSETTHRLLATLVTWGAYLFLGGVPMLILIAAYTANDEAAMANLEKGGLDLNALNLPAFPTFLTLMASFVIGMAALLAGIKLIQKRSFKTLITGFARVRWGRMALALGIWMALAGIGALVTELLSPGSIVLNPNTDDFFIFIVPALILIPIQSAWEEMAIRGQLLQNFSRRFAMPLIPLLLTSAIFALLHIMNNEVSEYGFLPMMFYYFSFGFFLGMFTLMDEGLEIAMGIHIGNNLFAFVFLTYPGAALETPSVFSTTQVNGLSDLGMFYASIVIVTMIFFGRKTRNYRALWANEPINPYS
ncbi:MAG: CPBP family intramembrane glutamic endopeptidase [Bacteroidota bacterium]